MMILNLQVANGQPQQDGGKSRVLDLVREMTMRTG